MKENILGYEVDDFSADTCCDEIFKRLEEPSKFWLACINPHSYAVSLEDDSFSTALKSADLLIPDGIGIVYASKFNSGSIRNRVTGFDIFSGLNDRLNALGGKRVYFLGSTEQTLLEIRRRFSLDYPNVEVVGTYSPPFKSEYNSVEIQEMISAINSASPDVLWVGLTAPKQEKWIADNLPNLNIRFAGAIGAVFDFYTGKVKRSHPMFQKLGLEWLPRLVQEPRRLWRRMGISAPIFVWHVLKAKK